jgi:hypothetical protein
MLLIRPYLRANHAESIRHLVIFFIFIVTTWVALSRPWETAIFLGSPRNSVSMDADALSHLGIGGCRPPGDIQFL